MRKEWLKPKTPEEWQKFNNIVQFAKEVKEKFQTLDKMKEEAEEIRKRIINICRECKDQNCHEECEVRKAYLSIKF